MKKSRIFLWIVSGTVFFWYLFIAYLPQKEICTDIADVIYISSPSELNNCEKKWVEFEYEFGHTSMRMVGYTFLPNHSFGYFKAVDKDEFFCAATRELIEYELQDKNFEMVCSKARPRSDGKTYKLVGFVRKITDNEYNVLKEGYDNSVGDYKMKNTLENTNMEYVIEILYPEDELKRLSSRRTWIIAFGFFGLIGTFLLVFEIFNVIKKKESDITTPDNIFFDNNV